MVWPGVLAADLCAAPAIEPLRPEVQLHIHGVTAEDVAAILARVNQESREGG